MGIEEINGMNLNAFRMQVLEESRKNSGVYQLLPDILEKIKEASLNGKYFIVINSLPMEGIEQILREAGFSVYPHQNQVCISWFSSGEKNGN